MAVTGQQVIDEARKWLGVNYAHQGRTREIGVDCFGFVLVVGKGLMLTELEILGYSNSPDGERFERVLNENCIKLKKKESLKIGDLMAVNYGQGVQHIMFCTLLDPLSVIHAKRPLGVSQRQKVRGVVEHRLIPGMDDFRGWKASFHIPGVEG